MPDQELRKKMVQRLVAQDPEINDTQMKEFRMQLEQSLESCEAKAKQTRRRILLAFSIYWIAMLSSFYAMSRLGNATVDPKVIGLREWTLIPLNYSMLLAMVLCVLLVLLYLFKYWPRLNRVRFDLQMATMREIHQEVKQLRERFERGNK
jgi:hypothetical protein